MKRLLTLLVVLLVMAIAGCGSQDGAVTDGDVPEGESTNQDVALLVITADTDTVGANGVGSATLGVRALNDDNALVEGVSINLSATMGALSSGLVTTDDTGSVEVIFDSGGVQRNAVATITASVGEISNSTDINIVGTRAVLEADRTIVGLNGSSEANLQVQVSNSSGDPVRGEPVTLTADLGFIDGEPSVTYDTDSTGQVAAVYTGGSEPGVDNITMSGPDEDNLVMTISGGQFNLTDTRGGVFNFSANNSLTLVWTDNEGAPVVDRDVQFSCSKCSFAATGNNFITLSTDVDGKVETFLSAVSVGPDTVTATAIAESGDDVSTDLPMTILADDPSRLILNIDPTVVGQAQDDNQPSATVTATVLDSENRAVQEIDVAFSIQSGPGGASQLSPVVATTNSAGTATTTFFSGALISAQNGVAIQAKVLSEPTISDSKTLTIANQPAFISIGEGNKIGDTNVPTQVDVESNLYALPFNLLITDTNGNPIANQEVSLGLYPYQFRVGLFTDSFDVDSFFSLGTFANEDANRNGILDAGEDGSGASIFSNNQLDPGGVATLPASVVTDENGFAAFSVVYAKSFAHWVDVEISAATSVSGTEYKSVINVPLTGAEGDSPFLDSPFGVGEVVPPAVVATSPNNGQTNVSRNAEVLIDFDRPMDEDTINQANISTVCDSEGITFHDTLSNENNTRFTLEPILLLPGGSTCEVTVSTNVRDLVNGLRPESTYRFSFGVAADGSADGFTGTGNTVTDTINLPEGLVVFDMTHNGSSNFIVELINVSSGDTVEFLANEIGSFDGSSSAQITDPGDYRLEIKADGQWTVDVR